MNKEIIGQGLKAQLTEGYDIVRISRWAFHIYSNERFLDPEIKDILEQLFSMEDDPQFELTQEELAQLSDKLIAEGELEYFSKPTPEIVEMAAAIGDDWLMCPICQESWEDSTKYGIVQCPTCKNKLHNPKFKPKDLML